MIVRRIVPFVLIGVAAPGVAAAQQVETLLPVDIPGYATPFGVATAVRSTMAERADGIDLAGLSLLPALGVRSGYDSAPNGAAGSPFGALDTSIALADPALGFGAYAGLSGQDEFTDTRQNSTAAVAAAGLRAAGATQTATLSAGYLSTQLTGFALDTLDTIKPVAFTVADARIADEVPLSLFTMIPAFSVTATRFPGIAQENRIDAREALTVKYQPGGPGSLIFAIHTTQSPARDARLSASSAEALFGVQDSASGLWTWRLLAGAAHRQAHLGGTITEPVLEAALDWAPTRQDKLRIIAAREVDDPDQIGATGYRLTEAKLSLRHAAPQDVVLSATADVQSAAYIGNPLRETLFTAGLAARWQLSPELGLTASYDFNDRQANALRAANEHVITLGATWTP